MKRPRIAILLRQKRELATELEKAEKAVWGWKFTANLYKHDYDQCLKAVQAADALVEAIEARGEIGAALDAYRKARNFD